jgi:pimeloyl-ACP methyl ester carboxylesterase
VLSVACHTSSHPPTYVPRDAALRALPLYFYPSRVADRPPRAFIFFLGNDVAFWAPHQELAWRLAGDGYTVVGLDLRGYLARLPMPAARRDSAFAADIGPLIARARAEVGGDTLPAIVGGHSFGAEVALWIALHTPPPRLVGVLAMSTRASGHLFVTPQDLLNREASGEGSFSTIQLAHDLPPTVRIAIVRGAHDKFAYHDSAFVAAGGPRLRRFVVPFGSHSLKSLVVAGPVVERAIEFLLRG